MQVKSILIGRNAKISTGQYENTDVKVELTCEVSRNEDVQKVARSLIGTADAILRDKIDDIELGKRRFESKAKRFGV